MADAEEGEVIHAEMLRQMHASGPAFSYRRMARYLGYCTSTLSECAAGMHAPRPGLQRDIETLWRLWQMPVTRDEYIRNAVQFAKRGNELPNAKLSPDLVREIRANRHGETLRQQAKRYGVHYNTIMRIRHYEAWRHVR